MGGRDVRGDMFALMVFINQIKETLVYFSEYEKNDKFEETIRGALEFLSYYPERKRKASDNRLDDMPKFGFGNEKHDLHYEQLVTTQGYLKEHAKILEQVKEKLKIVLDARFKFENRKQAALFCVEKLFIGMVYHYHRRLEHPLVIGPPVVELLRFGRSERKYARATKKVTRKRGKS